MKKVVLAYSGGLDTSVAIKWLKEKYDSTVIAVVVNIGQKSDFDSIKEKALKTGAEEAIIINAQEEFLEEYVLPAIKANALYEGKYPLISSLSRPLIAKHLVKVAREKKAEALAHGCTGKGNDQVRFETTFAALAPDLDIIAPVRDWSMSREDEIEFALKNNIPVSMTKESPYSIDENIWGRTIECGALEDPWIEPPEEIFELTKGKSEITDKTITISFNQGKPVSLNSKETGLENIVKELNAIVGSYGFGRVDMIENRLVGIKSREIYEAPAALAIILAHSDLESLTMERELNHFKKHIDDKYAELIYYGQWYSPLKEALDAFIDNTQKMVSGEVKLKLMPGNCSIVGRRSNMSLYQYELATYEKEDEFEHGAAKGFIDIFSLPVKIWAKARNRQSNSK